MVVRKLARMGNHSGGQVFLEQLAAKGPPVRITAAIYQHEPVNNNRIQKIGWLPRWNLLPT